MVGVRLSLGVAARAHEDAVIIGIGVARRAQTAGVMVTHGKPRVIEGRTRPRRRRVARLACGRETRGRVVGICRGFVHGGVTGITVGRRRGKIVVDVATAASNIYVRASQWERCLAVIESRTRPVGSLVAGRAVLREAGCRVVRIVRAVPVRQMARDACGRQSCVDVVFVAHIAGHRHMRPGQRKCSLSAVIENGPCPPRRHGMAQGTILGKSGRRVVGIVGAIPIRLMTGETGGRQACIHAVAVAGAARHVDVSSGQREFRRGIVIERRVRPRGSAVTKLASLRESGGRVIRVVRPAEIGLVAGDARSREAGKYIVFVARAARHIHMSTRKRKFRRAVVIERRIGPGRGAVADGAVLWKSGRGVVGVVG